MKNKIKALFIISICIILLITSCRTSVTPQSTLDKLSETVNTSTTQKTILPVTPTPELILDVNEWWRDVVFYEIFVRSFKDSDGDGKGDFNGIIEQLDYLNDGDPNTGDDLGIGGIWLMPINPSPSYHGYDVTDYYAVNPDYGTMDDFKKLLEEADKRGIRVIIDLVLNHTSTKHPWFKSALDTNSDYHDWFVWADENPRQTGPWGQNPWHRAINGLYYYGIFWSEMPDLNYYNPTVSKTMMDVSRFWLEEVGVDGFRVDAARYLYSEGFAQQDTPETIAWFQDWRSFYKNIDAEAYSVGEVWADLQIVAKYGGNTGLDSLFMFDLAEDIKNSIYSPTPSRIIKSYLDIDEYFSDQAFSTFLSNHDQQRVMSFYKGDIQKAKLAAFVYLTGPGTPFIYYGEEIGMTGNKPDEMLRTPMQWSTDAQSGFTSSIPWEPINPGWQEINVKSLMENPESLLNTYKALISLRNNYSALKTGQYLPLTSSCRTMYPVLRIKDSEILLILANLGKQDLENCTIALEESSLSGKYQLEAIFGESSLNEINFDSNGALLGFQLDPVIKAFDAVILKLNVIID